MRYTPGFRCAGWSSLLATGLLLGLALTPLAQPLPSANPRSQGFSTERLERMHNMVQSYVDEGKHAGIITAIVRNGHIVDFKTYGYRNLATKDPMKRDTIVRIYSMSKVITSAAVMQLVEQGKISLDDPIDRYLPELKDLKVCIGGTPDSPQLTNTVRPITIKHLLTHTAGFAYDFSAGEPVRTLYQRSDLLNARTLPEFITRLSKIPLTQQPGSGFQYGVNMDVLGALVEKVSGQSFEDYLQQHLCNPLGMKDTGFDVPPEKMGRLARVYEAGPDGQLHEVTLPPYGSYPEKGRSFPSGGGGMFSTADDYLRFGQMLLNGGRLNGKQVLGRKTVELMTANHITFLDHPTVGNNQWQGFGLGGDVRVDLASANTLGSVGQFGWNGAATTTFNIDPREKTVALLFAQHLPYNQHGIFARFYTLFYASLVD